MGWAGLCGGVVDGVCGEVWEGGSGSLHSFVAFIPPSSPAHEHISQSGIAIHREIFTGTYHIP